jgi:anti-sigma regulatory factor (Ser/Thr protein kinase)
MEARLMAGAALTVVITDPSQVGAARRAATSLAQQTGLGDEDAGRAALIATELATNLARHARGGELLLRVLRSPGRTGVELLAIDRGPGMANVERCFADGFSSGSSPGTGLGAIRRIASQFDVHSQQPNGTVLSARVFAGRDVPPPRGGITWSAVCMPMRGETVCGDAWEVHDHDDGTAFVVADGLGHGPLAAEASGRAAAVLLDGGAAGPAQLIARAHERLRGTRGAAVLFGVLDRTRGVMRYAGIGNVSARLLGREGSRSLVSLNGTVGVQMPAPKEFECAVAAGALLVVHSDGANTRWDLARDAALAARDPAVIAGALYRDHSRGNDDVTVLVGRRLAEAR